MKPPIPQMFFRYAFRYALGAMIFSKIIYPL